MTSIYFLKNIVKILRVSVLALVFSNGAVAADRNLVENGTDTSAGVDKSIIPKPHIRKRIYIGSGFYVVRVAFSPDGRYIAAGDAASPNIIIWDLEKNKEQTRIVSRSNDFGGQSWLHWNRGEDILWSPDNRYVTNGVGIYGVGNRRIASDETPATQVIRKMEFWNPITGRLEKTLDAVSLSSKFNLDGSSVVTTFSPGDNNYRFAVYDTNTWQKKEINTVGIDTGAVAWTARNKLVVVGSLTGKKGQDTPVLIDGTVPELRATLAQFIDPDGKEKPLTLLLAHALVDNSPQKQNLADSDIQKRIFAISPWGALSDKSGDKVAIQFGAYVEPAGGFAFPNTNHSEPQEGVMVLDTRRLRVLFTHFDGANRYLRGGTWGISFTSDGKFLIFLAHSTHGEVVDSIILNAETGKEVAKFATSDNWGLAISPDAKTMAIGHRDYIELFDLN